LADFRCAGSVGRNKRMKIDLIIFRATTSPLICPLLQRGAEVPFFSFPYSEGRSAHV